MIENSKGHFIPDEELAAFIYEGMHSGMFCFGEKETFLETEGKEEMGASEGELKGGFQVGLGVFALIPPLLQL